MLNEGKTSLPITDMRMTRFLLTLERASELIDWAYDNDTHGMIAIPKVESFSIPAIAKALLRWKNIDGELEVVGIRPGEKLHEEMISDIEWARTKDGGENYLITDEIITSDFKSYNSFDSLMSDDDIYNFLQESGVI